MMNRRRYEKNETYTVLDHQTYDGQSNDSLDGVTEKLKKDINIVIYSCADRYIQLWHETETEMLRLLRSFMR